MPEIERVVHSASIPTGSTSASPTTPAQNATAGQRQRPSATGRGGRAVPGALRCSAPERLERPSSHRITSVTSTSSVASDAAPTRSNDERYWV